MSGGFLFRPCNNQRTRLDSADHIRRRQGLHEFFFFISLLDTYWFSQVCWQREPKWHLLRPIALCLIEQPTSGVVEPHEDPILLIAQGISISLVDFRSTSCLRQGTVLSYSSVWNQPLTAGAVYVLFRCLAYRALRHETAAESGSAIDGLLTRSGFLRLRDEEVMPEPLELRQ